MWEKKMQSSAETPLSIQQVVVRIGRHAQPTVARDLVSSDTSKTAVNEAKVGKSDKSLLKKENTVSVLGPSISDFVSK